MSRQSPEGLSHLLIRAQSVDRLSAFNVPSNVAEQEQLFMSGKIKNPEFLYDSLVTFEQKKKRDLARAYMDAVSHSNLPDYEERVYTAFGESLATEIELGELAREKAILRLSSGDTSDVDRRFVELRDDMYGELPVDRYQQSAYYLLQKLNTLSDIPELREPLRIVYGHIAHSSLKHGGAFLTEESIKRVTDGVNTFELLPTYIEQAGSDADRLVVTLRHYLQDLIGAKDWDAESATILEPASTDRLKKRVNVNSNLQLADDRHLKEMTIHEGFHAYRAIMARQVGSMALLLGLPGSQAIEEGFATVFGKVYTNSAASLESFDYPVFVAGLMEHEGYDFRTSYEVFWRVLLLLRYTSKNEALRQNAEVKSKSLAYKILCSETRLFDKPRYRSLANAAGVKSAWQYLDAHFDDPFSLETLFIGKHNPEDKEHQSYLQNYI